MTTGLSKPTYQLFVGIDIAAISFTATWTTGGPVRERVRLRANSRGLYRPPALACDHRRGTWSHPSGTGGNRQLLGHPRRHAPRGRLRGECRQPAQAHAFARSLPRRAKTDALDAQLLTQLAAERQPARWMPPPQVYHELRQRLVVRDGLLSMRQQARNQRHALSQWPVAITGAREALDGCLTN
jgi:hypothetical protein